MSIASALKDLVSSVREDFASTQRYRAKYHGEKIPLTKLPASLVTKVGLQMLASMRVMQALDSARIPLLPQVASRLIRHAYGAEVHWKSQIAPGVSIVHGTGLVISRYAKVGPGCILFHNVTLGQGIDPETRETGAPTLGKDVHIGPGATLLGPITVGDGTKIMAGAVLTRSVPPGSLVRPAESIVSERKRGELTNGSALEQLEG